MKISSFLLSDLKRQGCPNGALFASTDDNGRYRLNNLPTDTNVKIRVYSKIFKDALWDATTADPDFILYKSRLFSYVIASESGGSVEENRISLEEGDYILDIVDRFNLESAKFEVTIE